MDMFSHLLLMFKIGLQIDYNCDLSYLKTSRKSQISQQQQVDDQSLLSKI